MALKHKTHEVKLVSVVQRSSQRPVQTGNEHTQLSTSAGALEQIITQPSVALRPADILTLQRTLGNRVVQRMLSNQPRSVSRLPPSAAQTIQRQTEEEEPLQRKSDAAVRVENKTGLPDRLKAGIENLSGLSLNDVRVHRNSSRPAELQARAYTQGTDIHLGPGQEKHLAHEAWHVVQQKQGRVRPTFQMGSTAINDDGGLEQEANVLGAKAQQHSSSGMQRKVLRSSSSLSENALGASITQLQAFGGVSVVQFVAAPALIEMKAAYDQLQGRIPQDFDRRVEILQDVTARKKKAKTLSNSKNEAEEIWGLWAPVYQANTAAQARYPDPPRRRSMHGDRDKMKQLDTKFEERRGLLLDDKLPDIKKELALEWYLKDVDPSVRGIGRRFYADDLDETVDDFKARVKAKILEQVKPGQDAWVEIVGYQFGQLSSYAKQLSALGNRGVHWTIFKANMNTGGLGDLKTTDNNAQTSAEAALIPNGAQHTGVHATLEAGQLKPHVFGRPADTTRYSHAYNLPQGTTLNDLAQRLNEENTRLTSKITKFIDTRNKPVKLTWENH